MSSTPNARELLEEARDEIVKAHNHLMELTAKLPMQYFGLVDGNIIQAEDCFIGKIDAYLAAPSESAMEDARETAALRDLVRRMRIAGNMVRDAMPNSVAVHNWIDVCAEADKTLEAKP